MSIAKSLNAPAYLRLLKGGTLYRMVRLNDAVEQAKRNPHLPPSRKPEDWRKARISKFTDDFNLSPGFQTCPYSHGKEDRTSVMVTFHGEQFRNERWADEVAPRAIDHRGWFSDAEGEDSETYRGFVFSLSHGRFGAGYYQSFNGERIYYLNVFDDERDAAMFADSEAEKYAEREREYQTRYREAQELRDEIESAGRGVLRMFRLRHTDGFDSAADYRELEDSIAELRNLKSRFADYSDIEL